MDDIFFEPRTYRNTIHGTDLVSFTVTIKETDLYIRASKNLKSKAERLVTKYRESLENYIRRYPAFLSAMEPYSPGKDAPMIVRSMAEAGEKAGTGPMAAVAGAVAEYVGRELLDYSPEIIIENGGDIFMKSLKTRHINVFAGNSPLSDKITIEIAPNETPLGICTSSGTIGHSVSYGKADAVVVLAASTPLADAAATAIGNLIKTPEDINAGIEKAETIPDIKGVLIIIEDKAGAWGDIKLQRTGWINC